MCGHNCTTLACCADDVAVASVALVSAVSATVLFLLWAMGSRFRRQAPAPAARLEEEGGTEEEKSGGAADDDEPPSYREATERDAHGR